MSAIKLTVFGLIVVVPAVAGTVVSMHKIGKPRKPVTGEEAAYSFVATVLIISGLTWLVWFS